MTNFYERYPNLLRVKEQIENAEKTIENCYKNGGKLLTVGNGGSFADADHMVAELMKGFIKKRPLPQPEKDRFESLFGKDGEQIAERLQVGLPAINICCQTSLISAFTNDVDAKFSYAQVAYVLANDKDVLVAFSTSGNSKNVVNAVRAVKAKGGKVISFTGAKDSLLSQISDVTIKVPEIETYKVQELHLPIYHYLCAVIEEKFFSI